jgi:hypothetical protein
MEVSAINTELINLDEKNITYEDKILTIKTDWMPTFTNKKFNIINVSLTRNCPLYNILKTIDTIVAPTVPSSEGYKHTKLLKRFIKKDGTTAYSTKPSIKFATIYNEKKEEITHQQLINMFNIECRYVFTFKIYDNMKYHGCQLIAQQMQCREGAKSDKRCLFE